MSYANVSHRTVAAQLQLRLSFIPMSQSDASISENQLDFRPMKDREALRIDAAPIDPLNRAEGFGGHLPMISIAAAGGAVLFGLLASGAGEPLLLTVIALLAMFGTFMLFA